MSKQTIKRATKDADHPYRIMSKALFEDSSLSFEAKGVLGYILVKPDDWEVSISDLMRVGSIGRDKAYKIIDELMGKGYCERVENRKGGKFASYTYLIHESPLPENPYTVDPPLPEKPYTGKPLPVFQEHTNKEIELNNKTTKVVLPAEPDTPPEPEKEPTEHQQMFGKVCEIVGWDYRVIDKDAKGQIAQTIGILKEGGYTLEHLNRFGKEVWANDWRWTKHRQRPSLKELRSEIGKLSAKPLVTANSAADLTGLPSYMYAQQESFYA